jgi:putative membrane protein
MITDTAAAQMASGEVQAEIQAAVDQQIQSLIAEKLQSEEVMSQVQAAVESAQAGAGQIAALKSQLDSYQTFYQGILAYTAGVAQCSDGALRLCDGASRLQGGVSSLKDGTGKLAQGTEELLSGASQMQEGIGALKDGGGALTDGVSRLQDGAGKLADGLREFDEEGISKLTKMLREDLQEILDRLDATTELSKQYLPFGQENPEGEDNGTFRFLYKTEAVK